MMGVYTLYKLGRSTGTKFDTGIKILDRTFHVIPNDFAEDTNRFSDMNGLLYVKSEQATDLYYAGKPFKEVAEYTAFEEVKPVQIESTVKKSDETWVEPNIVVEDTKEEVKEPIVVKASLPKALKKEDIKESIKELRATYLALAGKESKPMWGTVKLTQEINNLKKD
jgi:hypothetical protein